jgi:lipoyl-dependent peroxiredoxin
VALEPSPAAVPPPELAHLPARLRALRHEHGHTLDELAELSGLSKAYLSRLESGERQPSLAALVALTRVWQVPLSTLFTTPPQLEVRRVRRSATADWAGATDGEGVIRVGSGTIEGVFSEQLRVNGEGITPEELIGAAHAGCFTMKLSSLLTHDGYAPEQLSTQAFVHGEFQADGFRITHIELTTDARVNGLSSAALKDYAARAKRQCPVSRALAGVDISVRAELGG